MLNSGTSVSIRNSANASLIFIDDVYSVKDCCNNTCTGRSPDNRVKRHLQYNKYIISKEAVVVYVEWVKDILQDTCPWYQKVTTRFGDHYTCLSKLITEPTQVEAQVNL